MKNVNSLKLCFVFLFFALNQHFLFGVCCSKSSISRAYSRSDVVVKGVILEAQKVDTFGVVSVLIRVDTDYKSDCQEFTAFLNERAKNFDTKGSFEVGDEIIVLTSHALNNPVNASWYDYHCSTDYLLLKKKEAYPNVIQFENANNYFEYTVKAIEWAASQNLVHAPCFSKGLFQIQLLLGLNYYKFQPPQQETIVHLVIEIENNEVLNCRFAPGTSAENIKRIKKVLIGSKYYCIGNETKHEVAVSLLIVKRGEVMFRI